MSAAPDYKKTYFNRARELLPQTVWERPVNSPIDYSWSSFRDKLLDVKRMTVPMKRKGANGAMQPPWMTTEAKRAINLKKRHYMLITREATAETHEHYRRSLRTFRTLISKFFFLLLLSNDAAQGKKQKVEKNPLLGAPLTETVKQIREINFGCRDVLILPS